MTFQNDALIIMAEAVTCKLFFETFAEKKADKPFYAPYVILAYLGFVLYVLSNWLAGHFVLKEYAVVTATAVIMLAYLEMKVTDAFALAFLYQLLVLAIDYGGVASVLYFSAGRHKILIQARLAWAGVLCKLLIFLVVVFLNRTCRERAREALRNVKPLEVVLFPLFSMTMLVAVVVAYQYADRPQQAKILIVIAVGQLGMNIFVYYLLSNLLKRERKIQEEKLFMLEARSQTNMYQAISENFDAQRKKAHEFKNQILCIEGLLEQKKYDKAEEYVKGISGGLGREMDTINTNHAIINAVLNTKSRQAEEKRIVFVVKVNDLSAVWLEDADIVVILSNLLDNAIEAAEKCEKDRVVRLKFVMEDGIILSVSNTYAQKPRQENGKFVTSKQEKELHGIGMQNIIDTIRKYGGSYAVKDEGEEFLFSILISDRSCG